MNEIEMRNCDVAFGSNARAKQQILNSFSLDVSRGEFVVLVGPSGCGKTTVLNVMAGLVPLSAGTVTVSGSKPDPSRGSIGYMFQEYGLFPWRTVSQNIAFGLEIKRQNAAERRDRVEHFLGMMRLIKHADHYPHQISGGMRQRVALARTLIVNPSVLLMDEPFGALDPQTREELQDELRRIHAETNKTVVFVTHSIDEAIYLGDRVVVLKDSPTRIVQIIERDRKEIDTDFRISDRFFQSCKTLRAALSHG